MSFRGSAATAPQGGFSCPFGAIHLLGIRIQNIGLLTPFRVNTKLLGERIATSGYRPPRNDRFFDRLRRCIATPLNILLEKCHQCIETAVGILGNIDMILVDHTIRQQKDLHSKLCCDHILGYIIADHNAVFGLFADLR